MNFSIWKFKGSYQEYQQIDVKILEIWGAPLHFRNFFILRPAGSKISSEQGLELVHPLTHFYISSHLSLQVFQKIWAYEFYKVRLII